ncbi:hypothetical protein BG003_003977 [Podila horticola]|nr:hypothetical protein BG003_003977 [Podila horticola]
MANLPFHIPHIYHGITDSLSFSDLLKSILVNRHWHDTFIPILWSDAITFRTKPEYMQYHDYSPIKHTRRDILNHARHIQALTCQGFQSLRILRDSSCVNLVEINYVINLSTGCPGLDYLVNLMSVNPGLRAVSIEYVDLGNKTVESQFQDLLDFLDNTLSITSVAFVPFDQYSREAQWEAVWTRLCSRVDYSNIHSLCIHTSVLSRSKRALTALQPWPARETPVSVSVPNKKFRRALPSTGGRWENESRMHQFSNNSYPCIAVLENSGCLELCSLDFGHWTTLFPFLQSVQSVWGVGDDETEQSQMVADTLGQTICQIFPNLRKLDLSSKFLSSLPQEQFLPTIAGLSSLSLSYGYPGTAAPVPLLLSIHSGILVSLDYGFISMSDLFSVMASCPNLQELTATAHHQPPGGPEMSPPWICKDLRKMNIRITYSEEGDDFHVSSALEREKDSTRQLASSLLRQIGRLSRLQDLSMDLNCEYRVGDSPYFQLSMDPDYGLPQLAGLQKLKTFKVTGLLHSVGQNEIEWMRTNWPLLFSLEIPVLSDVEGGRMVLWRDYFEGNMPAYEKWYPGLKILVPESCYGCAICRYLFCEFDRYDDDDYDHIGVPKVVDPVDVEKAVGYMDWYEYEQYEAIWALDDEYHLSRHHNVHKCACPPKRSRRQMQCGHRY